MSEPPQSLFYFFAFNLDRKQIPKFVNKMSFELHFKCMESLLLLVGCSSEIVSLNVIIQENYSFPIIISVSSTQIITSLAHNSSSFDWLQKNEFHGWTHILVCLSLLLAFSCYYTCFDLQMNLFCWHPQSMLIFGPTAPLLLVVSSQ